MIHDFYIGLLRTITGFSKKVGCLSSSKIYNVRAFFLLRKILIGGKVDPFLPSMNEPRVGWLVAVSAKKYANKYDTVPYGRR